MALGGAQAVVFLGELAGMRSPAKAYSSMVGADIAARNDGDVHVPLDPAFEHAFFPIDGDVALEARALEPSTLYYLGAGRDGITLTQGVARDSCYSEACHSASES
jgi:redox-sensitive bicupin YhaK (pirin superfamily)